VLIIVCAAALASRASARRRFAAAPPATFTAGPAPGPAPAGATGHTARPAATAATPRYCEKCGTQLTPGEKFCPSCGAKV
jgi:hypothetical protein